MYILHPQTSLGDYTMYVVVVVVVVLCFMFSFDCKLLLMLNAAWMEDDGLLQVGTDTIYAMQFHVAQLR